MEKKTRKNSKKIVKSELTEVQYDILPAQGREQICLHECDENDLAKIPLRAQLGEKLRTAKCMFHDQVKMIGDLHGANIEVRVFFTIKEKED